MHRIRRFLLGMVGTALVVFSAFVVWTVGVARFSEDYCITEVDAPPDAGIVRGPEWELPMTYRCDFGTAGEVTVNEPRPILFTGMVGGVTVLAVAAIWWWLATHPARRRTPRRVDGRSSTPEYEGKHRA